MLQMKDLNFMKGYRETLSCRLQPGSACTRTDDIPHVLQLLKYTKAFYLRCFMTYCFK